MQQNNREQGEQKAYSELPGNLIPYHDLVSPKLLIQRNCIRANLLKNTKGNYVKDTGKN